MANAIYIGSDAILQAYDAYDIDTWALLQGKEIRAYGNGSEELKCWLIRLQYAPGGFKLCLYPDIKEGEDIRKNSDYSISVPVLISEGGGGAIGSTGGYAQILTRLDTIEKRISGPSDDDDDDGLDIVPIVKDYLQNPHKIQTFISGIMTLMGKGSNGVMPVPAAAIGSTQPATVHPEQPVEKPMVNRLSDALDKLEKYDPDIVIHLEKLAFIAETQPGTFKTLLTMLNGF